MDLFAFLASSENSGGGFSIVILLLLPLLMYFLLIRPQRKRLKDQNSLQASLGQGDEVITTSGIYGFISAVDDDFFWLEIDDDVQIRIAKAAVQRKIAGVDSDTGDADDATDDDAESDADKS